MKKLLVGSLCLLMLLFSVPAMAQTWFTANQVTVGWDAVTTLDDGSPLPTGDTVQYRVYLVNAITDPSKTNPTEVTTAAITELEYTMTLGVEGKYFVGLLSERIVSGAGGEVIPANAIAWSDDPAVAKDGNTFGVQYFIPPAGVTGMEPR